MPSIVAICVFSLLSLGLFFLDRDRKIRTSGALWIPVIWLWIIGSRPVSEWLGLSVPTDSPDQGNLFDRFVFSVLLAAALGVVIYRRRQVVGLLRTNWPIVLYFGYCALSILWSDYPLVALLRWVRACGDLLVLLILVTDGDPLGAVKRVLSRVGFLLLPCSVLLIKYFPDLGRGLWRWSWAVNYTGVTTNKNTLGMICFIFGIGSTWRLFIAYRSRNGSQRTRQILAHVVLVAMALWLLWMANSMTSISCFALACVLLAVTSIRTIARKPSIIHVVAASLVALPFAGLFVTPGSEVLRTVGRDPTLTGRTEIWRLVLHIAGNPWVGTGFESFWLGQRFETVRTNLAQLNEAHNGFLEVYLNLGWIGIILLTIVIVCGYRNIFLQFHRSPEIGGLRLALFVAAIVYSFTEAGFRMLNPVWVVFLWAAMQVSEPAARVHAKSSEIKRNLSEELIPSVEEV